MVVAFRTRVSPCVQNVEPNPSHMGVPASDAHDCVDITMSSMVAPKVVVLKRSDILSKTYPDLTPPLIVSRTPMLSILRPFYVRL